MTEESPWERLWRENEQRRSIDGLIDLAEHGDAEAARQLLGSFILQARRVERRNSLERKPAEAVEPRLLLHVARLLTDVLSMEPKNAAKALGIAPGESGRPSRTHEQHLQYARLALAVADAYEQSGNLERATEAVAAAWSVSKSKAEQAYKDLIVPFRKTVPGKTS